MREWETSSGSRFPFREASDRCKLLAQERERPTLEQKPAPTPGFRKHPCLSWKEKRRGQGGDFLGSGRSTIAFLAEGGGAILRQGCSLIIVSLNSTVELLCAEDEPGLHSRDRISEEVHTHHLYGAAVFTYLVGEDCAADLQSVRSAWLVCSRMHTTACVSSFSSFRSCKSLVVLFLEVQRLSSRLVVFFTSYPPNMVKLAVTTQRGITCHLPVFRLWCFCCAPLPAYLSAAQIRACCLHVRSCACLRT